MKTNIFSVNLKISLSALSDRQAPFHRTKIDRIIWEQMSNDLLQANCNTREFEWRSHSTFTIHTWFASLVCARVCVMCTHAREKLWRAHNLLPATTASNNKNVGILSCIV